LASFPGNGKKENNKSPMILIGKVSTDVDIFGIEIDGSNCGIFVQEP
jgi:hypothetical protein